MDCIGLIAMLIMLSDIGWVMDLIIPGRMPYGWLGGIVAAIIGGMVGGFLFGFLDFGPWAQVGGTRLYWIPALLGAIVVAFVVRFIMGQQGRRTL